MTIKYGGGDNLVKIWRINTYVDTNECITVLEGHIDWIYAISYSKDGTDVVLGGEDRMIRVWDVETEDFRILEDHEGGVYCLCHSSVGTALASGGYGNEIKIWDLKANACTHNFKGQACGVASVRIKKWNMEANACIHNFKGHTGGVASICYSATPMTELSLCPSVVTTA